MASTKDKIVQATIEWIKTNGYESLSMRKLAAQIGMTTGALYKYFQNKETLFYQVSIKLSQRVAEKLTTDPSAPAEDQLLALADGLCRLSQRQPRMVNFLFFNPSLRNFYQDANHDFQLYNQVMGLVQQVNQGGITDQQFFIQIWAFIQGYTLLILNGVVKYDQSLVARTLEEMIGGSQR